MEAADRTPRLGQSFELDFDRGDEFERALIELGLRVSLHIALENESTAAARPIILRVRFAQAVM
jgi:hypothetical protein